MKKKLTHLVASVFMTCVSAGAWACNIGCGELNGEWTCIVDTGSAILICTENSPCIVDC